MYWGVFKIWTVRNSDRKKFGQQKIRNKNIWIFKNSEYKYSDEGKFGIIIFGRLKFRNYKIRTAKNLDG